MYFVSRSAADVLRQADGRVIVDEDGNEETIRLLAPLSPDELQRLESVIPCALPTDARELLSCSRGFEGGPLESIDLGGLTEPIFEDVFPHGLPIGHDGYGNYWVVDLTSASTHWGPILYACHDPPVVVYQCADVATFIENVLMMADPPYGGPIDEVHERHVMHIWRENPGAMSREVALTRADDALRAFVERLTSEHYVVDLRQAKTGDGFSWGRFGPNTPVTRAGTERIFAYERRSKASRLARFFRGR
jgi:hypothetical protein